MTDLVAGYRPVMDQSVYSQTVLGSSVYLILCLFLIYSFLGVLIEVIFCLVRKRVLESRSGLLYLPLRPIYGIGGVGFAIFPHRFLNEPILVFLWGVVIGTVVEYVAALITEKAFGGVAWDYSDKLLNLQGKICLQYSCCWGLLALLAVYVLNPLVYAFVRLVGGDAEEIVLNVLTVLTLLSAVLTTAALLRIRKQLNALEAGARGEMVTASESAWDRLISRVAPDSVMINTCPRMSLMTEFMEVTGQQRAWIRVPLPPWRPSA
jgi:uncharacterized membrane protein